MKYIFLIISLGISFSQFPSGYKLKRSSDLYRFESISDQGLASNGIMDIRSFDNELLFIGTGTGLSFADLSFPENIQYRHFTVMDLPKGGNPALTIGRNNNIIAVSGVLNTAVATGTEPKGTGISYSKNGGESWNYLPQPVDPIPNVSAYGYQIIAWGNQFISSLAVTTDIDNVSYDIAVGTNYIYTANWAGGIRRYRHSYILGTHQNWEVVPLPRDNDLNLICDQIDVEEYKVNPKDPGDGGNHNHKGFGVYVLEDTLWAGTAGGINKGIISGDCINWVRHYQSGLDNISGNWVIGFTHQNMNGFIRLWAITWATQAPDINALSYTDNGGASWNITNPLGNEPGKVYDVTTHGDSVWASTEIGLYLSVDGKHWEKYDRPIDIETGEEILSETVYSSYYSQSDQTLWVGTNDGLALIHDETSKITRFWTPPDPFSVYPNPFLINDYNQVGNNGYVRFVYSNPNKMPGKIDIFDFSMDQIIHLNNPDPISINGENEIIWNGRNEYGDQVANGVYFCRLHLNSQYYWTKLAVIN